MRARVKAECPWPAVQSAGEIFSKIEWKIVPEWAEAEILDNEYLEVEATLEPATTTDEKLAKMVVPKVKRGKTL